MCLGVFVSYMSLYLVPTTLFTAIDRRVTGQIMAKVGKLGVAALLEDPSICKCQEKSGDGDGKEASTGRKRKSKCSGDVRGGSSKKAAMAAVQRNPELYGVTLVSGEEKEGDDQEELMSNREMVEKEIEKYVKFCKDNYGTAEGLAGLMSSFPRTATHKWWGRHKETFPILFQVARAVLTITASSGNLERDFCDIKSLIPACRTSLSPWIAEMLLMCHSLQREIRNQLTPDDVLELDNSEVTAALPKRVTSADLAQALEGLDIDERERQGFEGVSDLDQLAPWMSVADLAQMWDNWEQDDNNSDI